jgi:hypothetical protein
VTTDKLHALFFTSRGAGPDNVSLWTEPVPPLTASSTDPTVIAPRTLGLRVGPHVEHVGDERHFTPLLFAAAGGFQMDEATVRTLHAQFGAWLDAPRLAARESAEVVAEDDGVRLLKTTAGEWGVAEFDHFRAEEWDDASWTTEEPEARRAFAKLRGKAICECGAEVDPDEMVTSDDDVDLCPACHGELREEWLVSAIECVGSVVDADARAFVQQAGCGWTGKGSDAAKVDDGRGEACPTCGGDVELVEPAAEVG